MKKCPICHKEMSNESTRCDRCNHKFIEDSQDTSETVSRQYRTSFIVIALCCAGPLALPLVWKRPNTSRSWKTIITVLVLLITLVLCWVLYLAIVVLIHSVRECYQLIEEV